MFLSRDLKTKIYWSLNESLSIFSLKNLIGSESLLAVLKLKFTLHSVLIFFIKIKFKFIR